MANVGDQVQVEAVLKQDALGRIERLRITPSGALEPVEFGAREFGAREPGASADPARSALVVRRVASGSGVPGSRLVAHWLAARERRALRVLSASSPAQPLRVPKLIDGPDLTRAPSLGGTVPLAGDVLLRSWIEGVPLHAAERLPHDFFDELLRLVEAMHARGVCHNDLHKEQNVLVTERGWPALVDFQLASVHTLGSAQWKRRAREDRRHVQKHLRRYVRHGRGPADLAEVVERSPRARRSALAWAWRRWAKPVYNAVFGRLGWRDKEARRASNAAWPVWGPALRTESSEEGGVGAKSAGTRAGPGDCQAPEA